MVTLEDPVEYQMGGVNQLQINERVGLSFASGLRTILRQDPDIVMVGEIRDPETASIAMQASMTGHLVLSTLHTNDAPSAVSRLIDMGARTTEAAIKEEAVAGGMRSMRFDGLTKALAGRTTLEEVPRVAPPDPDLARRATRRAGAPPPSQIPPALKTPPKVLVLDDDRSIAEVAAAVLVNGYEVVAASHLDEGLRMVEAERPDLVLVDLDLPGADPAQLLARLRQSSADGLPVLVMSATDDHPARDRASAAGATGFIPKPFSEPQLRAEVAAVLQRRPALVDHRA